MLKGICVSPGIALGSCFVYKPYQPNVKESFITLDMVSTEIQRYQKAKQLAINELNEIKSNLTDEDKAKIFTAHLDMVCDEALGEDIVEAISEDMCTADYGVEKVFNKFISKISRSKDPIIRERAADFKDVKARLIRNLEGIAEKNLSLLKSPCIIVAHDLFPSDTATLDRSKVLGIACQDGGLTSHTAIIAKSYEIPAIMGIDGLLDNVSDEHSVILDALTGELIINPTSEQTKQYLEKQQHYRENQDSVKLFLHKQPFTKDGVRIDINLNIGGVAEDELAAIDNADGVGLFRSEFLYMDRETMPTEEEQFVSYKKVLERAGDKPIILRTLDIGGDKKLNYLPLPSEDNPFLGCRALRLCFEMPQLFRPQLRAALRASVFGNLWIMLPMVGGIDDIRRAKTIIDDIKFELKNEGIAYNDNVKIGIMIEIPSIALIADLVVKEVDFASIGTNDLCQYLSAVDRLNSSVACYYQGYHPALFRCVGQCIAEFNAAGKTISVCGEMGGNPIAAAVFIGLGMRKLSMTGFSIAPVKKMLASITTEQAKQIAGKVLKLATADEVERYLNDSLGDFL